MDFILGQPWLRAVEPAIDWGIQRVLWEQDGDVVSVFGRKAPPRDVSTGTAAAIEVEVVSTKRFCHDIARGVVCGASSWVGLLSPAEGTCAAIATTPADLAGTSTEQRALHDLLHEFRDVFAAPGKPPQSRVKHRIELVDPTRPPSKHRCYRMS